MFDRFGPFKRVEKQRFSFQPSRYETWEKHNVIDSGNTDSPIIAKVIHQEVRELVEVEFGDANLHKELASKEIFDELIIIATR